MEWGLFALGGSGWGDELLRGLEVTLSLAVLSYAIGIVLGTLCGLLELRRRSLPARLLAAYAAIVRSVPELLVIFLVYFGLAYAIGEALAVIGIPASPSLPPFQAGVIALAIVTAAYASEVAKGAVGAVRLGVREAGLALGLKPRQVLRLVTLPLALRLAFPGLANLWMVVVKLTPLVSAIQLEDFISAAGTAGQNTKRYFLFYGSVVVAYLVISGLSLLGQTAIERRLFRHLRPMAPR